MWKLTIIDTQNGKDHLYSAYLKTLLTIVYINRDNKNIKCFKLKKEGNKHRGDQNE